MFKSYCIKSFKAQVELMRIVCGGSKLGVQKVEFFQAQIYYFGKALTFHYNPWL
jgi:hypothetical protein